jgi:hypothetical protein
MRKFQLLSLLCLSSLFFIVRGQQIESFDGRAADSAYFNQLLENPSTIALTDVSDDKVEGTGSLRFHTNLASVHSYGTYAQIQRYLPEGTYFDWSTNDSLSLWIKVTMAPSLPASFVFRIHIADQPTPSDSIEEYIYEHATIIDAVSGWVQLKVPLNEREVDVGNPDDTGFILFPAAWSRDPASQENNLKLDYDKIIGYNITAVSLTDAPDSVEYLLDDFEATGFKSIPLIVFNGKSVPSNLGEGMGWGQSSVSIEEGAGSGPQKNAIKWVQGDEYGNGWTGIYWNLAKPHNLADVWDTDSLKFKCKSESWSDTVDIALETDANGKMGYLFVPPGDNQWHEYAVPLSSFMPVEGTTGFDPASIGTFGIMAGHPGCDECGSGVAGSVLYFDDIWTGNPDFDVIAPTAPSGLAVVPGSYINLITWSDVSGEEGESYNLYYSKSPITDVSQAEVVKLKVEEDEQLFNHVLRAPATDQDVSYYYAITCTDAAGNISGPAALSNAVTNTARGVTTISLNPPSSFTADGELNEWAGITPIHMAPSGGGYPVQNFPAFTGDADLSLDAYIAVDNTYLYVAFDVEDDVTSTANPTSYENDAPDLFLGLYNWHGLPHTSYKRGEQPDYHFRFAFDRCLIDGLGGGDSLLVPGENYFWGEKFPTGYSVEARIPWQLLADRFGDNLFVPKEGYRIPIDFSINDNDGNNTDSDPEPDREGILTYSPDNNDQSWNNVSLWLYTWIGNLWEPVVSVDDVNIADTYSLSQNYPNPFNPVTQIRYTLERSGLVTLKVYDLLGRLVTTLVDEQQNSGLHTVNFNASKLTSGVYFYEINSGSFRSTKKMMLVK